MKEWLLLLLTLFLLHPDRLRAERLNEEIAWQTDLKKPFMITMSFHPPSIHLGDVLSLEAEFHFPSSYQIDIDACIDALTWSANPLYPQWALIVSEISPLSIEEGVHKQKVNCRLTPLTTGPAKLSFLKVVFVTQEPGKLPLEVITPIFSFDILQPLPPTSLSLAPLIPLDPQFPLELTEANKILFLENPQELEKSKERIRYHVEARSFPWMTLAFLLGCGGIGWVVYLMLGRRMKQPVKSVEELSPKQLSPKQRVEQGWNDLLTHPFHPKEAPLYYQRLSSMVYDAIEARLGWKTQKLTTTELDQAMREETLLSSIEIEEALFLLAEMDQVKFAGKKPSLNEVEKISDRTRKFVTELSNKV